MRIHHVIIALVGASLLSSAAAAEEKIVRVFKPAGPWAMEYADQTCRLIRNFSDETDKVTFAFEKTLQGPALTLGLVGKSLQPIRKAAIVRIRYNDEKEARPRSLLKTVLTDGRNSFLIMDADFLSQEEMRSVMVKTKRAGQAAMAEIEMEAASRTTWISLTGGFTDDLIFSVGPMAAPLKAINACVDDLVKSWGVDPQRVVTMSRVAEPVSPPQTWLSTQDYPEDMWRAHQGGIVPVRLVIDELGAVQDCLVTVEQRGSFEEAVCKAISKRAHFRPAIDADGKPMRSYWARVVVFSF